MAKEKEQGGYRPLKEGYQPKEEKGYQPQDTQQQNVTPPQGGTAEVSNQSKDNSQNDT